MCIVLERFFHCHPPLLTPEFVFYFLQLVWAGSLANATLESLVINAIMASVFTGQWSLENWDLGR